MAKRPTYAQLKRQRIAQALARIEAIKQAELAPKVDYRTPLEIARQQTPQTCERCGKEYCNCMIG